MAVAIGKENTVKLSSQYVPYNRGGKIPKTKQGKVVGVIARKPKDHKRDYNPLVLFWVVNPYRKDLNTVIDQQEKKPQLPAYEQSLFDSCFKNW
jgi:hypothetical protein